MNKRNALLRYSWILRKLEGKRPIHIRELLQHINDKINDVGRDGGKAVTGYSLSTFKRDKAGLQQIFGIHIEYSAKGKGYYIEEGENAMANNMLEAFETFQSLQLARELPAHVHLEKRALGTDHLSELLSAIKQGVKVTFTHSKYWDEGAIARRVAPYALKMSMDRWYLIGKDDLRNDIRCFGLDRISDLQLTRNHFDYPVNYKVEAVFKHCFGIICPQEEEPEEIILSFYGFQGKYIKSLPLHVSQEILLDTQEEIRVKLYMFVTDDLIMELMKHGEKMKVLQPQSLIVAIRSKLKEAVALYD